MVIMNLSFPIWAILGIDSVRMIVGTALAVRRARRHSEKRFFIQNLSKMQFLYSYFKQFQKSTTEYYLNTPELEIQQSNYLISVCLAISLDSSKIWVRLIELILSQSYFHQPNLPFKHKQMKSKLSFAQRLVNESRSRQKYSGQKNVPTPKAVPPAKPIIKTQYMQFKQQHNQLKKMLKLFQKVPQFQQGPQLVPPTPVRNRLNQRKNNSKVTTLKIQTPVCQAVKENIWQPKPPKTEREEFRSYHSTNLPRSEPIIPQSEPIIPQSEPIIPQSPIRKASGKAQGAVIKKGIPNIGNTCYINSLVQCLFHLPHFNDYFADQKYKVQRNSRSKDMVEMYRSLYMNVMRSNTQVDLSTLPLKRSVSKLCSLFIDWAQEDAHEFMKELFNSMHEDLNRVKLKPKYKQMNKELEGVPLEKMAAQCWSYQKERDDSYIYDTLCGQTYNNIRCINCTHQSQCFENFMDLSLPISSKTNSLQALLRDFFQPEKLSDYYYCDSCKKSSKRSLKTVQLWRVPKFLIIHLKRSQFGKKNTDAIRIAVSLSFKPFMTISNDKTARFCQYSLCGIIMHQGVLEGGHYWCNVKQNGKWFQIDDDRVKELNSQKFNKQIQQLGSTNAYILFYSSLYC